MKRRLLVANAADLQRDVMRIQATDCDVEEDDDGDKDIAIDDDASEASKRAYMAA